MGRVIRAEIDGRILRWARSLVRMTRPIAADKIGISVDRLESWEEGRAKPTIRQLRKAASVYGQSFAVFFLPEPPEEFDPDLPDYRRFTGVAQGISPELALDIRTSAERRISFLELRETQGRKVDSFEPSASIEEDPERVAHRIREALQVSNALQQTWRNERVAFNEWRMAVESLGALVFQARNVALSEVRAYSLALYPAPVITVNRKDFYRSRSFSLVHELAHLAMHRSGICDLSTELSLPPEEQRVEVFCNSVAAAVLVPADRFLNEDLINRRTGGRWDDDTLRELSRRYSVSMEVILRRLVTLEKATLDEYRAYRDRFDNESFPPSAGSGFVPPPTDTVSLRGRKFVSEVLDAFNSGAVTSSDTSALLGVRLKHLDAIETIMEA